MEAAFSLDLAGSSPWGDPRCLKLPSVTGSAFCGLLLACLWLRSNITHAHTSSSESLICCQALVEGVPPGPLLHFLAFSEGPDDGERNPLVIPREMSGLMWKYADPFPDKNAHLPQVSVRKKDLTRSRLSLKSLLSGQ